MNPTTFDELERFVSVYNPSEVLLLSPFPDKDHEKIQQYCGIHANMVHTWNTEDPTNTKIQKCEKFNLGNDEVLQLRGEVVRPLRDL